jgi:hypothetical protein
MEREIRTTFEIAICRIIRLIVLLAADRSNALNLFHKARNYPTVSIPDSIDSAAKTDERLANL